MSLDDVLGSDDFQSEETPIESSWAAEITGTVGLTDDDIAYDGAPVPDDLAGDVEDYDRHHDTQRQVPLGALKEERAKRQEAQAQLEQARQQRAAVEQQLAQFAQHLQAQQQAAQRAAAEAAIPSFSEDPEGHVAALREQFAQRLEQIQAGQQAQVQAQQQAVQIQQVRAELAQIGESIQAEEADFASRQPDYVEAVGFLQHQVTQQLRAQYPGATPQQLELVQAVALGQATQHCRAQGVSPVQWLYSRALARGWQGSGAPAQRQARPAAAPAAYRPAPSNLGNAGGAPGDITTEQLAAMSDTEFDAYWSQLAAQHKPRFFK
ncbi:hypothetical protein E8F11_22855 [Pseudomonas sp. BN417]|uniref:hypothetical protein n=1 Tax=Pseudomonas sp. BN417 TaxID=2567890 RepID=UPI00245377A7|nr:hypothetical protein [Pseudomonas sp. BN417]MDH4557979.1 hypothetical protein [Pseudomonas sp. BN417]